LSTRELLAADLAVHPADVSGDSQLTPLDAVLVINAVNREESAISMPQADLNTDGVIDVLDVEAAISALVESDQGFTLAALNQLTSGDGGLAADRSAASTDSVGTWQPLVPTLPGTTPLPGTTGPTPGTNWDQTQITGAVRVATQYPEPMPLIYNDEDLVNDPNDDGFALYQGRVPFVVEVTYPDYDFAVDLNLEIYVSLDGVERHYRSERVQSDGGRHLTQFVIPTGAAESVKVRAELINNNLGLVQNGNPLIATGEKTETMLRGELDHVKMLPWTVFDALRNYVAEDVPGLSAKYLLESLEPAEITIQQLMQELEIDKLEATALYNERLGAAIALLEAKLKPGFEGFADHALLRPMPLIIFSVGESDDKSIDVLDLTEFLRREMERDAPLNALKIKDLVYYEFTDAKEIFKSVMGKEFQQFISSPTPIELDLEHLEHHWKELTIFDRLGLRVPIKGEGGEPTGEARLYFTRPSFANPGGTGIGSGLDLRTTKGNKQWKITSETGLEIGSEDKPASVNVRIGLELTH